jgi:uncharacterized protein (TIGR02001 family)
VLRWLLALATALLGTAAQAQLSISVATVSDDRFRGVSLSDGKPAAQFTVAYDHDGGAYAGAFASNVQFDPHSGRQLQMTGFAGYALRLRSGLSIDAGASYSGFTGGDSYNYVELQAGVTTDSVAARVYYSPDYFGLGIRTVYGELNGSRRLTDRLKLVGHAGLLKTIGSTAGLPDGGDNPHLDLLAGLEYAIDPVRLQLSRVANDGSSGVYPLSSDHIGAIWTLRISASF